MHPVLGHSGRSGSSLARRPIPIDPHRQARAAAVDGDRADRELLFEAMAIHLGFVPRIALDDMETSRRTGVSSPGGRPLGQVLVERSILTAEQSAILEMLVDGLVERYGDVQGSLDSLAAFGRVRAELERLRAGERGGAAPAPTPPCRRSRSTEIDSGRIGGADRRRGASWRKSPTTRSCPAPSTSRPTSRGRSNRDGPPGRWGRPHPRACGSASSGPTPRGASARSRSHSTPSSSARWR